MKKNLLKMLTIFGLLVVAFPTYGQIDCDCDFEFDPVCVTMDNGEILTFPNACFAECEGYGEDTYSECDDFPGDPCDCGWEFDPVCVELDNGDILPFPNVCLAECEGYGEDSFVECDDEWPGNPCDCEIDPEDEPVCVLTAQDIICVFPNLCFAECEGYSEEDIVECDDEWPGDPCNCDDEFDPVCVEIESGIVIPFPNACYAECEGFTAEDFVECDSIGWPGDDCDCEYDHEDELVCVLTAEGIICPFPNMCFAECMGYTEEDVVDCGDIEPPVDCVCPDIFDPVCVETDDGAILLFPNACYAECEGFGEDTYVDCGDDWPGDCVCTEEFDPVCVELDNGDILSFPNACFAECEGFGEDEYFECEIDDPCGCDDVEEVVCVEIEPGFIIPFPNECYAICAGFGEDSFVDCLIGGNDDQLIESYEELFQIFSQNGDSDVIGNHPWNFNFNKNKSNTIDKAIVYPNPIDEILQIELTSLIETEAQISVLSIAGKQVDSKVIDLDKGSNTVRMNSAKWTPGIYFAKIQTGENVTTLKFVK